MNPKKQLTQQFERYNTYNTFMEQLNELNYSLQEDFDQVSSKFEQLIFETEKYMLKINSAFEDNYISYDDGMKLVDDLEYLNKLYDAIMRDDEIHKRVLKLLLKLRETISDLVVEVSITEDVEHIWGDRYSAKTYKGYYLNGETKLKISEVLSEMITFQKEKTLEPVSDTVRDLIQVIDILTLLDKNLVDDVIYVRKPFVLEYFHDVFGIYNENITNMSYFYLGILKKNLLKEAISGIRKILENEQMTKNGMAKIRGLIFDIDGYKEIIKFVQTAKQVT